MHMFRVKFPARTLISSRKITAKLLHEQSLREEAVNSYLFRHFNSVTGGHDNPYEVFPPDLLHTIDGGLVRYSVLWTLNIVKVKVCTLQLTAILQFGNCYKIGYDRH